MDFTLLPDPSTNPRIYNMVLLLRAQRAQLHQQSLEALGLYIYVSLPSIASASSLYSVDI